MNKNGMVRFSATLKLYVELNGGRRTPVETGFRADLKCNDAELRFSAFEIDGGPVYPGSSRDVYCCVLLHSEREIDEFLEKKVIDVVEGHNKIGTLLVKSVVDRPSISWR